MSDNNSFTFYMNILTLTVHTNTQLSLYCSNMQYPGLKKKNTNIQTKKRLMNRFSYFLKQSKLLTDCNLLKLFEINRIINF